MVFHGLHLILKCRALTKCLVFAESLHGDTVGAHLSRLIWLYLHSGQQFYMDAMKGFVYECAYASYTSQIYESASIAAHVGI